MSGIIGNPGSKSGVIGTTELDYEEGSYSGSGTNHSWSGNYVKIGTQVTVRGKSTCTGGAGAVTQNIVTLPFSTASGMNSQGTCWSFTVGSSNFMIAYVGSSSSTLSFYSSDGGSAIVKDASTRIIEWAMTYITS